MTREERLRAAVATSPEMASLNVGSLNFGIFPMLEKYSDWKHDWEPEFLEMTRDFIFKNTFADLEYVVKELGHGHGTRFEFECYDLGHLYNLAWLIDQGWLEPPYFVQMVFGVLGGVGADLDNLDAHAHHRRRSCSATATSGRCSPPVATRCRSPPRRPCSAATCASAWRTACSSARASSPRPTPAQVHKIRGIVEALGHERRDPGPGPAAARRSRARDHVTF